VRIIRPLIRESKAFCESADASDDVRETVNVVICSRFESRGKSLGGVSVVSVLRGRRA